MASIRIRNTNERIESEAAVATFLEQQGVLYEHWDITHLPPSLRDKFVLSDDEKNLILQSFGTEIQSLATRNGYTKWDIVALSDATPNLDELLAKFQSIHTHSEDEVRAITAGSGIFVIKGQDGIGYFDVELTAGDVISVPVSTPHFFTLMSDRHVVAVRLFIDPSGWVAQPYADPEFVAN